MLFCHWKSVIAYLYSVGIWFSESIPEENAKLKVDVLITLSFSESIPEELSYNIKYLKSKLWFAMLLFQIKNSV